MNIFILEDNHEHRQILAAPFHGIHDIRVAGDLETARCELKAWWPDVAIVDAVFPRTPDSRPMFSANTFLDILEEQQQQDNLQHPEIILVSGHNDAAKKFDDVGDWLQHGRISDVIPKSTADVGKAFFQAVVQLRVEQLLSKQHWRAARRSSQKSADWFQKLGIVTCSPKMLSLQEDILAATESTTSVLIQGPNGSGKELIAVALRNLTRPERPFQVRNCGTIPTELFESEMVGIEEHGKNNNVYTEKEGFFELAKDGTAFLDEIQDLPASHMVKLNRVLQERKFQRLGGTVDLPMNARIISATNKNLRQMVDEGNFKMDLYYRLAAIRINVPALSERKEDIPLLSEHFLRSFEETRRTQRGSSPALRIPASCEASLMRYSWPGNVRQLENCIKGAAGLECIRNPSSLKIEISIEALLKAEPELCTATIATSPFDEALIELGNQPLRSWADWTDAHISTIINVIQERLSATGRDLFSRMQQKLDARTESLDPAAIHCYKALLYFLLTDARSASIDDLKAVLQLRAWESAKKVATILTEERTTREPRSLVSKTKLEGRWVFALSPGVKDVLAQHVDAR